MPPSKSRGLQRLLSCRGYLILASLLLFIGSISVSLLLQHGMAHAVSRSGGRGNGGRSTQRRSNAAAVVHDVDIHRSVVDIEREVKAQLVDQSGGASPTPQQQEASIPRATPQSKPSLPSRAGGTTLHNDNPRTPKNFNKASELAELLRHALWRNNRDNLEIDSDEFVHNDHEESIANENGDASSPQIQVLDTMNSSDFNAAISGSEPTIIRGQKEDWCTNNEWTLDFIRRVAGNDVVGVETSQSNRFYSNAGLRKARMRIADFLDVFTAPNRTLDYYLAEEGLEGMPKLLDDLRDPEFAEHAQIDKRQIWVGAGGQVSPLHHDQWDNVLCQIRGTRYFTLFDPLQVDRLYPKSGINRHFSQLDPEHVNLTQFPKFKFAKKYTVKVSAGEMLIIPAFWWHQVRHAQEVNVAVNFWFTPSSLLAELLYDILLPNGPNTEE